MKVGSRYVKFGKAGESDLWGTDQSGQHWEIEVKCHGKKPTLKQLTWLREMTDLGVVAYWADSADVAERVAMAMLAGGRVVWGEGSDYDIQMP